MLFPPSAPARGWNPGDRTSSVRPRTPYRSVVTSLGTGFDRTRGWLRAHPLACDAGLAAAVLVCMVAGAFADPRSRHDALPAFGQEAPGLRSVVLMVLGAGALVFRRRNPFPVLAFTGAVSVAELLANDAVSPVAMSTVIALYTVASRTDRPTTWRVGLATMATLTVVAMLSGPTPGTPRRTSGSSPGPGWRAPPVTPYAAAVPSSAPSGSARNGRSAPVRRRRAAGSPRSGCGSPAICTTSSPTTSRSSTSRRASPRTSWTSAPTRPRRRLLTYARPAAPRSTNCAPRSVCSASPATRPPPPNRPPASRCSANSSAPSSTRACP